MFVSISFLHYNWGWGGIKAHIIPETKENLEREFQPSNIAEGTRSTDSACSRSPVLLTEAGAQVTERERPPTLIETEVS